MERERIDALLMLKEVDYLIQALESELNSEYDEYALFKLGQAYLLKNDKEKAGKIMRRLSMVFPFGEVFQAGQRLNNALDSNTVSSYLEEEGLMLRQSQAVEETEHGDCFECEEKQKESSVSVEVRKYFEDEGVVGLESVRIELDRFYKLFQFQKTRQEKRFHVELLKSTHFYVAGARGSGKTMVAKLIHKMLRDLGVGTQSIKWEDWNALKVSDYKFPTDKTCLLVENAKPEEMPFLLERQLKLAKGGCSCILMGTQESWEKAVSENPCLQDIVQAAVVIPPYSSKELLEIMQKMARKRSFFIHENAKKALIRKFDSEKNHAEFMNAITLNRILDKAIQEMAERFYELETDSESTMVYLTKKDFGLEEEMGIEDILKELDAMPGLHSVKEQVNLQVAAVQVEQKSRKAGSLRKDSYGALHMRFTGNPGTGKTTVARMLGKIYYQLGVLSNGHVVECTRSDLIGSYMGQTAKLVREKVRAAAGGVLFIDEAYALCQNERDIFGQEAVNELIAAIENHRSNMMVILAGYKNEIDTFLSTNPGFKSRVEKEIHFEDYSVSEMVEIFHHMVRAKGMVIDLDADQLLYRVLEVKSKVPDFGNARGVRNVFEEITAAMNQRIQNLAMQPSNYNVYDTITKADIEKVIGKEYETQKTIDELIEELNSLTGLSGVKQKVQEMLDDIRVQEYIRQTEGTESKTYGTLHLVFKGNAGTGKTTVARILGQIYKELGLLKRNVFVEVNRADLVANYQGQTATKVMEKVKEAEGGILFIDEAYTLINDEKDSFGKEAVGTLVPVLENYRDRLMVILAGYGPEMDAFLETNQGLASRLSNEIFFEDYTEEELEKIFRHQAEKRGLLLAEDCGIPLASLISQRCKVKDFGNARGIRNLLEQIEKKKNSRIASLLRQHTVLDRGAARTICAEDIQAIG